MLDAVEEADADADAEEDEDHGGAAEAATSVDVLISSLTTMSRPRGVNMRSPSSLSHLEN